MVSGRELAKQTRKAINSRGQSVLMNTYQRITNSDIFAAKTHLSELAEDGGSAQLIFAAIRVFFGCVFAKEYGGPVEAVVCNICTVTLHTHFPTTMLTSNLSCFYRCCHCLPDYPENKFENSFL